MIYLLTFIVSMSISMALIPLLIRAAPVIGMIDIPDARKVHEAPIPRIGGIGIVLGALIPMLLWAPNELWMDTFLFGCGTLLVFGVWDDCKELGHYVKFVGQLIAVVPVVYYSELYVSHFPFMAQGIISPEIGKPFTVFAIMGMINAINHSDGLDGLAGGMATLSLACIGYLAFMADGFGALEVVAATMGGVFGFLRFNNHPARVFMGDGGSQVLGFTLGVLAVVLSQNINPALSPALPLLILGLPIMDILAVFWLRARGGQNWFKATKNHIHHRLLDLGFDHYESVVLIYFIQILFIVSAITLRYESDWLITSIYLSASAIIFISLTIGETRKWSVHSSTGESRLGNIVIAFQNTRLFRHMPSQIINIFVPGLFILISILAKEIPMDLAASSLALMLIIGGLVVLTPKGSAVLIQAIVYITAAFIVYLESNYWIIVDEKKNIIEALFFIPLAFAIALAVRYSKDSKFKVSTMDYLVIVIAILSGVLLRNDPSISNLGFMVVKLAIIFYGAEFIINRSHYSWNPLNIATIISLFIIGVKGIY